MSRTHRIAEAITSIAANTDLNKEQPGVLLPVYKLILNTIERYSDGDPDVQQIVSSVRDLLGIESKSDLDNVDKPTDKKPEGLTG